MSTENNNNNNGIIGSPLSGNSVLSGSGSVLDSDKIQKIVNNYQKVKNQNAILKKALLQEQQKTNDLEKGLKEKEQALTTSLQEHDVLDFNNQRLTKRIQLMQDHMNEKKESGGQWFGGKNQKLEIQKKEEEINILRSELQEKIDDNEGLHSVNIEKENAYKSLEQDLKSNITEKEREIQEKQEKINVLLIEQKESEKKLHDQTKGLRDAISLLEINFKQIYSSTKQRDDSFIRLSELIQTGLNSNLPLISFDYPLENITPSNERFPIEDIIETIEKSNSNNNTIINIDSNTIKTISDRNSWIPPIKSIIGSVQQFLSYHLEQVSQLISSHRSSMSQLIETNQQEFKRLNQQLNDLLLQKEELEFRLNTVGEQLLKKEFEISEHSASIKTINETISKLQDSNQQLDSQSLRDKESYNQMKKQFESQIKSIKSDFELEMKQAKDQNQALLKHQKGLLNSKINEKDLIISNLEKKLSLIQKSLSNNSSPQISIQQQQQQQQSPILLDLNNNNNNDDNNTNANTNTNTNSISNDLIDLSFLESNGLSNNNNNNNNKNNFGEQNSNNNNSSNSLINLDDDIILDTQIDEEKQIKQENNNNNNSGNNSLENSVILTTPRPVVSDRFKLSVLDETGDESDSLNFSMTDKERENEMKVYYENKITQLLNKISNIDAKALRYYDQYQQLMKKGGASQSELDSTILELKNCKAELKNTKDELEVTRVNYDQQMRYLTEQFISLNENVSSLDSQLIKIKQYKVSCGKCKHWNQLEFIFSPNNQGLYCSKGHPILTIQP
ncbi:hypothetical protein ACTFIR_010960 [Dictyostelium discoideum]